MKQTLLTSLFIAVSTSLYAQVGIGVTEPKAYLNVLEGKTVLFGADTVEIDGEIGRTSPKMIWYASSGAFRAGGIDKDSFSNSNWNKENVGPYSFASGRNTKASGNISTAMGTSTVSSGESSTAMGAFTYARGYASTAMGYGTIADGDFSTAMGRSTTAADFGSFIIGDASSDFYNTTAINQMMMRFQGGYIFYTGSNSQEYPTGVELKSEDNAWSVISDSTRKENFRATDGALFLKKISGMRLGSWNYKGQNAKQYRHYGPMAQDFFAAFGRDELGLIGEEKSINQADFDGVNLIAIQALIKEVEALKAENANLKQANASTKTETESLKVKMQQFEKQLSIFMASGTTSTISK